MAESEDVQTIVNQAAIQVARTVIKVLGEADAGPRSGASTARPRDMHRQRHGGLALKQPSFNWNVRDKYVAT